MRKYNKENIMSAYVDMFCLVCETYLKNINEADRHIRKPIHKKNLSKTHYIDKFKNDNIKKVPLGYYCECCNLLFSILSKVSAHVEEDSHLVNKNSDVLRREGKHVIVHNELLLDEKTWQGIKDNTCSVCVTEFQNEAIHTTQTSHVINLMKKKIVFGQNNVAYRVVDGDIFHCLTCNEILSVNSIKTHFVEARHYEETKKCSDAYHAFINNKENIHNFNVTNKYKLSYTEIFDNPYTSVEIESEIQVNANVSNSMQVAEAKLFEKSNDCDDKLPTVDIDSINHGTNSIINHINNVCEDKLPSFDIDSINHATDLNVNYVNNVWEDKLPTADTDSINHGTDSIINHDDNDCEDKLLNVNIDSINHGPDLNVNNVFENKLPSVDNYPINNATDLIVNHEANVCKDKLPSDNVSKDERKQDKILEFIQTFEKNEVNINFETETAFCKKCIKNIDFDYESINKHIQEDKRIGKQRIVEKYIPFQCDAKTNGPHEKLKKRNLNLTANIDCSTTDKRTAIVPYKNYENINKEQDVEDESEEVQAKQNFVDHSKDTNDKSSISDNDLINYAKMNHLTYNKVNKKVNCCICMTRIPFGLHSMKEHVRGTKHRKMLLKHEQASIPKTQSERFFENVTMTNDLAFINYQICIRKDSFFTLSRIDKSRIRCHICEVDLFEGQISTHLKISRHQDALKKIPVVTCLKEEFVRELRHGIYHCGYCNCCIEDWNELKSHLNTPSHIYKASELKALLNIYLPKLKQYKFEKAMERLFFNLFL